MYYIRLNNEKVNRTVEVWPGLVNLDLNNNRLVGVEVVGGHLEVEWSSKQPTEPGFYWYQATYSRPEVVELWRGSKASPLAMLRGGDYEKVPDGGRWAGPILAPEEPRAERACES